MAGLFKNRIIREKLEKFEIENIHDKLAVVRLWQEAYKKGELQKKNETQCEQAFNADFFINVLGYTQFPKDNFTIQPKDNVETGGGQMPDATLGYFNPDDKRVVAVVEIKDANTPLDKSQRREGNLSPVQQAFKYKPQYKECGFVIATNFYEIRLFRDNQLDYERFTLDTLVDPKDDYFNFRKFYYLLGVNNFVTPKGQSVTEQLLSAIRIEQEDITTKFYKEYKKLREDLIADIVKNNPDIKRSSFYDFIVEKAQKIIDRLVFVCFFEDSGLLPDGKIIEVVEYAQKGALGEPVWQTLKKFFAAVDVGSERLGIPDGYNGELFKPDERLDSLVISDEICKRFIALTKFDFKEDLSVNILGHIFEQSIVDLERMKNYSAGEEVEISKKDSKRKKDGIYYTPEYVVDYIVKNSLGKYLEEKEQYFLDEAKIDSKRIKKDETYNKKLLVAYTEYQKFLRDVKVLDLACGSGAFLVKVFDYLLEENKRISDAIAQIIGGHSLMDSEDYVKLLLRSNIYGVDLNPESVEITKLSLWLKSAKRGHKLITLKDNIKCGNSLVADELASDRAFVWEVEFSNILSNGGFDIIVGNPPYVDSESMVKNDPLGRKYISENYKSASGNWDLYIPFIEKGYNLLKDGGMVSMIVPNKWLSMNYGIAIRDIIQNGLSLLADLSGLKVFDDANLSSVVFSAKKAAVDMVEYDKFLQSDDYTQNFIPKSELSNESWGNILVENRDLIKQIESGSEPLSTHAKVAGAFTTGEAYELIEMVRDINIDSNSEYYKLVNTGTLESFYTLWGLQDTVYLKNKYLHPVVAKNEFQEKFPKRYLKFNGTKIIVSGIRHFESILDSADEYLAGKSTSVIYEISNPLDEYSLICILNSKLITYYLKHKYATSGMGGGINFSPDLIKSIPLKLSSIEKLNSNFKNLYLDITEKYKDKANCENRLRKLLKVEFKINALPKSTKLSNLDKAIEKLIPKEITSTDKFKTLEQVDKIKSELLVLEDKLNRLLEQLDDSVLDMYGIDSEENRQQIQNYKSV